MSLGDKNYTLENDNKVIWNQHLSVDPHKNWLDNFSHNIEFYHWCMNQQSRKAKPAKVRLEQVLRVQAILRLALERKDAHYAMLRLEKEKIFVAVKDGWFKQSFLKAILSKAKQEFEAKNLVIIKPLLAIEYKRMKTRTERYDEISSQLEEALDENSRLKAGRSATLKQYVENNGSLKAENTELAEANKDLKKQLDAFTHGHTDVLAKANTELRQKTRQIEDLHKQVERLSSLITPEHSNESAEVEEDRCLVALSKLNVMCMDENNKLKRILNLLWRFVESLISSQVIKHSDIGTDLKGDVALYLTKEEPIPETPRRTSVGNNQNNSSAPFTSAIPSASIPSNPLTAPTGESLKPNGSLAQFKTIIHKKKGSSPYSSSNSQLSTASPTCNNNEKENDLNSKTSSSQASGGVVDDVIQLASQIKNTFTSS